MSASRLGSLGVDLREAGPADRDLRLGVRDQAGELGGAPEAALGLDEVGLSPRRIAAQREDVLDPGVGDPVDDLAEALGRLPDAAQVRHRFDPVLVADRLGGLQGFPRGSRRPRRR